MKSIPSVLIATLGTEPQVVTASAYLLLRQGQKLEGVYVIHSVASGTPISAAVDRLAAGFATSPNLEHLPLKLVPIMDAQGRPLPDIDTPEAVQAAFRLIYQTVRLAKLGGQRVHFSIAGGRKTLAAFGMVTAQLLFDDHDCLWHLYSNGDFLASKRLFPEPGDEVHLEPLPVILWSDVAPVLLDLVHAEDPFEAIEQVQALRLAARLEGSRSFIRGALTPGEERVVALLVREGLSDQEIAERLFLSPRTVEQHLRSVYTKAANHWELANVNRTQLVALLNLYYTVSESAGKIVR